MKRFLIVGLLSSILGLPLTAQCDTTPSRPYQVVPSKRVPKKATHYVQRINRAPIRYFPRYPSVVNPRSRTYRSYRSPRVYVYANPSCPPTTQTETNYHVYHQYEYIQEYPVQEYYENHYENNYYYPEYSSENTSNNVLDSYYVERRPVEESESSEEIENLQNPIPIKDFFYFMETGRSLFKRGQYEAATKEFSQAMVLDRYSYAASWGHGMSLFALGKYASASFSLRKGLENVVNPLAVHENLRRYYDDLSRFDEQLDHLDNYLQTYPFDMNAHFVLAFTQFYTQNYVGAQPILEYILKITPQDASSKKLLQALHQELERQKKSVSPSPTEKMETDSSSLSDEELRALEDELLGNPRSSPEDAEPSTETEIPQNLPEEAIKMNEEALLETKEVLTPAPEVKEEKPPELTEEEKQRIIDENNEKALENYEKLLKNARGSKKSSSLESSTTEKPLETLPVQPKRLETLPIQPKAKTRAQIQFELNALADSFQNQKMDLLSAYAELKRQYYSQEIDEARYQALSDSFITQYDQLQADFAQRKEQLQAELKNAR